MLNYDELDETVCLDEYDNCFQVSNKNTPPGNMYILLPFLLHLRQYLGE